MKKCQWCGTRRATAIVRRLFEGMILCDSCVLDHAIEIADYIDSVVNPNHPLY